MRKIFTNTEPIALKKEAIPFRTFDANLFSIFLNAICVFDKVRLRLFPKVWLYHAVYHSKFLRVKQIS